MKAFFALAFLAVACAAELEPVELPEPAVPYVEPVRVVEAADQDFVPDDNLHIVNFVDAPELDFAADANRFVGEDGFQAIGPTELESLRVYDVPASALIDNLNNFENDDGYQAIAPSELESVGVQDIPQEDNMEYPYRPRLDPMWR